MIRVEPKPAQFGEAFASIFRDPSVADAYRHRPGYPDALYPFLAGLLAPAAEGGPRRLLDAGCGPGPVARGMLAFVDAVDAVDFSQAMVDAGRRLPGGDDARLRWIASPIESAPLEPPYALITAAASLHWMDWERTLPRFARALAPGAVLALIEESIAPCAWQAETGPICARYSMNRHFRPYDVRTVADALALRGLFATQGAHETGKVPFEQSIAEWIESLHARNGFSRDRMPAAEAAACDAALAAVLHRHLEDGVVRLEVGARVIWGSPLAP